MRLPKLMGWLAIAASIGWGLSEWYHQKQRADNAETLIAAYQLDNHTTDNNNNNNCSDSSTLERQLELAKSTAGDCKLAFDKQTDDYNAYISRLEKKAHAAIGAAADCKRAYDHTATSIQRTNNVLAKYSDAVHGLELGNPDTELDYRDSSIEIKTYLSSCNAKVAVTLNDFTAEAELYSPNEPGIVLNLTLERDDGSYILAGINYQGFEPYTINPVCIQKVQALCSDLRTSSLTLDLLPELIVDK